MSARFLACLALVALSFGCQRVSDADQKAAIECVRANLAAMEKGDIEAAMATIHPQSPIYAGTREQTEAIFQQYRLALELESVRVGQVTPAGIHVHFVQVTRKLEGPDEFIDNRVEGTHLLKRDGVAWKIWSTRSNPPRMLDGQPLPGR